MTTTMLLLLSVAIRVVVLSIPSASAAAAATPGVGCSSSVLTMADCLSYLSNNSTMTAPEGGCCSGLKQVLKISPGCLCQDFQQSAQLGISLNLTKAMTLPSDCHVHAPASAINCAMSPSSAPPARNATGTGAGTVILSPSLTPSRNSGTAILVAIVYFLCRRKARQAKRNNKSLDILEGNQHLDKFEELPLFKFEKLSAATNNFQECNKLGQGGFGPVYKGTLEDGQEVAIKRLSGTSRQGAEEFMNEVLVISKLQHRNLVKLLGCCGERLERMLIYEYMPNRSLDAFLFDPQKKGILDWKKRYSIIEGISRGLLYLHRDSRLKIIHRDLKAANILLDENLNPKISDFGMARIFGGTQIEADTTRVVGTYGYMPPEYAIEGRFSEKSDVFSFGVLLLEIITGKKTRWFDESSLSLLGYVWKQWIEDDDISLIDPIIAYQGFEAEISKCIHVGLLCVQEYAQDRPDISDVITKLGATSTRTFQKPKQPGFTRFMRDTSTSTQSHLKSCTNDLSITNISGR
ncbi:cysteine-rich receptor-like protein kinase 44 isoform X2 [Silene latifolia]|uniref:cysteine-rich receptor-like protein kinase 44 isoform X2 n=1 Tax=Silene latifolia TaxID=37657 RepID=UPI003D772621